jgi:SAM-dependent methyltransferase
MAEPQIRFEDGAAYERMMGVWSRLAGATFLDWLAPASGLRWIDVGCGNGAFTELIVERCAPVEVQGIDPSEAQLAFARGRPRTRMAQFSQGDATALPFADASFDAAVMALVLFFVPDPARGLAEMLRVTRPGGMLGAYVWDIFGGGLPMAPIHAEMRAMGLNPLQPPSAEVSRIEALGALWRNAGIETIETREIAVERTFANFDDLWTTAVTASALGQRLKGVDPADIERLKSGSRARLPADVAGRITYGARANAVKGRKPG